MHGIDVPAEAVIIAFGALLLTRASERTLGSKVEPRALISNFALMLGALIGSSR